MKLVHSVAALRSEVHALRSGGRSIGLVPTMGNLHAGHASLVRRARELADEIVATVFVNPLQFGPNEDFARYPRTLDADRRMLEAEGTALLFAPPVEEVYPNGYPPVTTVRVSGALTEQLEGEFRPGHFDGVATIVNILFNLVQPDVAVFGEKDYQQLQLIRRMASDLGMPIRIEGAPTLRASDGLALSSRNQYLAGDERTTAAQLYAALQAVAQALCTGRRDFDAICGEQLDRLAAAGFRPQYLVVRSSELAAPSLGTRSFRVLAAAWLGATRLIDNIQVDTEECR
jgi:pantoate--beta-alanine ligase